MLTLLLALLLFQRTGVGATLPDVCTVNDIFLKSGASPGTYRCTSPNTWTIEIPTSGGGDLLAANNLSDVASASTSLSNLGGEPAGTFSGIGACGANTWASTLNDTAAPTCTQPGFSNLSGSAVDSQIPNTITLDNLTQVTTRAISDTTGTLTVARGGTGAAPGADDQLLVADSTVAATWKALNDCQGAGKALTYTASTNTFGCNTISGSGPTYVLLTQNRATAVTSYADITDLIIPVSANTRYEIACFFNYAANATTTGLAIGWTGPASPTLTNGIMSSVLSGGITTGASNSVGNDTGTATASSSLNTAGNTATFRGMWSNGANAGNVQMRFKSEVATANAIVIQAGSFCKYNTF